MLSGARQNGANSTHRSAGNSLFCPADAKVLTATLTYRQSIICMFYFVTISHTSKFFFFISYLAILFTMLPGFKLWEFYLSHPFARNKQSVHIVSVPAGRTHSLRFAGHTAMCSAGRW